MIKIQVKLGTIRDRSDKCSEFSHFNQVTEGKKQSQVSRKLVECFFFFFKSGLRRIFSQSNKIRPIIHLG